MTIEEFKERLYQDIDFRSSDSSDSKQEIFLEEIISKLREAEDWDDEFVPMTHDSVGSKGRKVRIDGYLYNELDNYLSIFITDFSYSEEVLTLTDAEKILHRAQYFIEDASFITKNGEESSPGFGLATDILTKYKDVRKYSIYLVTDRIMSRFIKAIDSDTVNNKNVEYHIWDLARIFKLEESKSGKEDITINLSDFCEYGIPCLEASSTNDYTAYLCNIPGDILANLYNKYGGRLLEGNVRSFLQTKGAVNKGIRTTILTDPTMFFAYNNGIAATASEVETEVINGQLHITKLTALQIVNGGQTTASLATALLKDTKEGISEKIKSIFVPMKLSKVTPEKAQTLIPDISKYANSQNKVTASDLWSNHPFHIKLEEFSRSNIAPAVNGQQHGTYWYYERANGQYRQETYKSTDAKRKEFEKQHPKNQMFNKTELSKYINLLELSPHIASAGGQRSFAKFSEWANNKWEKDENSFNKEFFKKIVAVAILYKETDELVKKQPWYNSYKANIVLYTLAKIMYEVKTKYSDLAINYKAIWQKQSLSPVWISELERITRIIHDEILINPERIVQNVTEWAKREGCWFNAKKLSVNLSEFFIAELIDKSIANEEAIDAKEDDKEINRVMVDIQVHNFGEANWGVLSTWAATCKAITPPEKKLIDKASTLSKRFPSEKECIKLMEILKKAESEGFVLLSGDM